jgi:hypothetical protein
MFFFVTVCAHPQGTQRKNTFFSRCVAFINGHISHTQRGDDIAYNGFDSPAGGGRREGLCSFACESTSVADLARIPK